jgi:hypothetical protein
MAGSEIATALCGHNNTLLIHLRRSPGVMLHQCSEIPSTVDAPTSFTRSQQALPPRHSKCHSDLAQRTQPEQELELSLRFNGKQSSVDFMDSAVESLACETISPIRFALTSNHLVADSWSVGLLSELKLLYASRAHGGCARLHSASGLGIRSSGWARPKGI